ncbi:MAG: D-alanyl-D-alanine carboxypeptidase/D-alanyl-D-alanine endopeptidase [Streptosporangiaceae bacterium]
MIVLALLNVFAVGASVAVAVLAPAPPPPPPRLAQRRVVTPAPALRPVGESAPVPDPKRLADAMAGPIVDHALGSPPAAVVVDVATGRRLYAHHAEHPSTPASTTKLTTATAVLRAVGPAERLATRVVRGTGPHTVILVGGGDPTLTRTRDPGAYPRFASLDRLAARTVHALKGTHTTTVRLGYDASLYTGPSTPPTWKHSYVSGGNVAPVSALELDEGRVRPDGDARVGKPPKAAAEAFAELLDKRGITVRPGIRERHARRNAKVLAKVSSPPVATLVEHMLTFSDNDLAEALGRRVALAEGEPPSFAGAARAITSVLGGLGVRRGVELHDASGLSPKNAITPRALVTLLRLAASARHPNLRPLVTGLPVAGFSGTLRYRYDSGSAKASLGLVHAKTGTLNGVSALAGYAYDADGRLLAFAFLANHVQNGGTWAAEAALDTMAATVARCGCRGHASRTPSAPSHAPRSEHPRPPWRGLSDVFPGEIGVSACSRHG